MKSRFEEGETGRFQSLKLWPVHEEPCSHAKRACHFTLIAKGITKGFQGVND